MGLDCVIRPQALALSTKPYKTLQKPHLPSPLTPTSILNLQLPTSIYKLYEM